MTAPVWGATPDDWAALEALDLTEDLLPVVSRPDAPISPGSSMATKGKTPSDYNAAGNVRGISDWTQKLSTAEEVTAWSRQPDYGICLQTRRVRGIDVDIGDADLAADVLQTITHTLGLQLPKRSRANSAKFLCPVRVAGIMAKRVIVTTHGAIEFLATGQQFIAVGTHPSGAKYEWGVGLPTEIPEITAEEFEDLWSTLHMLYAITDSTVGSTTARKREARIDVDDPLANHLAARRLVLRTKRNGGLLVACPWAAQHSSGTAGDTSTVYFPAGTNGYRTGSFKCQHGHCGARKTQEFAAAVDFTGVLAGAASADADFAAFDDEPVLDSGIENATYAPAAEEPTVDATAIRLARLQRMKLSVLVCPDVIALEQKVAPRLAAAELSDGERFELVIAIQSRTKELIGGRGLPAATIRRWLTPTAAHGGTFPDMDSEGKVPLMTDGNVKVVLERMGVVPRYNIIAKKIDFVHPGEVSFSIENAGNNTRTMIVSEAARLGMRPAKDLINNYIDLIAAENSYNPALDWLQSAPWDGISRIDALAATITARDDFPDERKRLMLRKWLIQGAALAATEHPITARGVLIAQGAQYVGKSRWLKSLVPGVESLAALGVTIDASQRDSKKSATRAWLVELGELDATFKRSDIAALKAFVAQDVDERRDAYERDHAEFMRRTSFYGSVNGEFFLHDDTGNTRFWVIPVIAMDHEHGVDMQQVWAEALALWRGGEPHWLNAEEMGEVEKSGEHFSVRSLIEEQVLKRFQWERWTLKDPEVELKWLTSLELLHTLGVQNPSDGDAIKAGKAVRKLSGMGSKSDGRRRLIGVPMFLSEGIGGSGSSDSATAGALAALTAT